MQHYLARLAPHSRVWIFQSDRFLTENEVNHVNQVMKDFVPQWASHGNDLYGDFYLADNLFLMVGVDESRSPASGCSIDSLTRVVKGIGAELNIDFFNRLAIAYENNSGKIDIVSMNTFKEMIASGEVSSETIVFNNLVNTQGDLNTSWKTAAKNSWHTNLFQLV